jgi:cupin 2 domain-containing protein
VDPPFLRGRLEPATNAPAEGERVEPLVERPGVRVEQILSGELTEPAAFDQDNDELVLVVEGWARLLVAGTEIELESGEWLFLPAHCAHTLLETRPGTSWFAVHLLGTINRAG